jgi:hypothetical protein
MMRIIDEFRHAVKFECSGLLQQLEDDRVNCFGRWLSVSHLLLAFERKYFVDLEIKEGRIYHEFVALPSDYRRFAVFKGKRYAATLDIRACHPTFLGRAIWELFQQDQAAIEEKLNGAVDRVALERQASQWTKLFTDENADPRGVIMEESEIRLQMKDMKQCLNTWLNGAKKYRRKTDGRWDLKNNQRLEAWFQARFPEIARVWTVMEQRQITGRIIMEEYEYQLMLNPALYRLGDELALTLAYEYDGAGVFATPNDPDLPAKLDIVRSFIQEQSMRHFGVPVVVKGELIG